MDAIQLLHTRQSCPRLGFPGPTKAQLDNILDAGVRVPDHANLTPWEFVIAEGEGLDKLSAAFCHAAKSKGLSEEALERVSNMPKRAPMVITIIARVKQHPKVPAIEQVLAAGCAAMAMQQAAFAQGLGGIWRTGEYAFDEAMKVFFDLSADDQIIGYLYIGSPEVAAPIKPKQSGREQARFL